MNKNKYFLILFLLLTGSVISSEAQVSESYNQYLRHFDEVTIELDEMKNQLTDTPMKGLLSENRNSNSIIALPMPDGTIQRFRVVESPILSPELSAQRPNVKSYAAQGIDDPTANARFNITTMGLYGVVAGIKGISIIEPVDKANPSDKYVTYYDHDIVDFAGKGACASDATDLGIPGSAEIFQGSSPRANSCFQNGSNLLTYDMVVTCSGEFYQLNGNSNAGAEAALLNRVTQINTVYEREVAISFTIVEYLLNSNAATDPFSDPTNTFTSITEAENHINANATVAFDVGHGFHEITCGGSCGWAGRAGLGVVCTSGKARGYTYLPNDIPSSVTVLLHEIGHMFSCRHTNYGCGTNNNCGRYEPGQGSSIMSTSAGCSGDDFFASRTDYFGIGSLQAIMDYSSTGTLLNNNNSCSSSVVSGWSNCATSSATGNNEPSSDANANSIDGLTIPYGTPFTLTGSGSDADGTGSLTYNWEQFDTDYSGSDIPDDTGSSTTAPLFRSFPPATTAERTCPQLTSVLAGNVTTGTGEILPMVARTMTWRLTVRDNVAGGGGIACDEVSINVGSDGPFRITSQNTSTAWSSGDPATITWDVANTDDALYTCPNVDILYSSDGGNTFGTTLASNVANDGSESITVPATATTLGRIKIVCSGGTNIFFDINDTDIAVISGCPAEGGTISNSDMVSAPVGDAALNLSLCAGTPVTAATGVLDAGDSNSNLAVENNGSGTCIQLGNSPKYETFEFSVAANASVTFTRTSQPDYTSMMALYQNSYDPANECDNWMNSNGNFNGVSTVNISSNFTEALVTGTKYVLLPSAFSSATPSTGNYDISTSVTVYDASAVTPTGFLYTYVIVNTATGTIVAIDADSDLSNSGTFPAGDYAVHGLSYQSSVVLGTYVGGPFTTLQTDLTAGTICGDLSTNSVSVEITGPLPVEIIAFNGRLNDDQVWLNWMTETEINNDYFIVEKSTDGRNFQKIGTVQGSGTSFSTQQYELVDPRPSVGVNYYRLTQFDYDGAFKVIDRIVAVDYFKNDQIAVQPNPVTGNRIQLIYQTNTAGSLKVDIYNVAGQLVKQLSLESNAAYNVFDINLDGLDSGVYVLKTVLKDSSQSLRFVKTN